MLFLTAIDRMDKDELLDLLAFAESATFQSAMREAVESGIGKGKRFASASFRWGSKVLLSGQSFLDSSKYRISRTTGRTLGAAGRGSETVADFVRSVKFDPHRLTEEIPKQRERLAQLSEAKLRHRLVRLIGELAGVKVNSASIPENLTSKTLMAVARYLRINTQLVSGEDVERLIFERYVEDLLKKLKAGLKDMKPDEEQRLEELLREELDRLSSGDREAIKKAMKLDELTEHSLLQMVKSGGIAAGTLMAMEVAGFGLFLAATTMLHALSLLIGTTFAFSTYTAATAFLGFLTGPIGATLAVVLVTGTTGGFGYRSFRLSMLTTLVCSLHARLLRE
jgi:uncharacterized protein YaaW (UPF0174 family)